MAIEDLSVKTYDGYYDSGLAEEDAYVRGSWVNGANNKESSQKESARVRPNIGLYLGHKILRL